MKMCSGKFFAVACVCAALLFSGGCKQKRKVPARDYSQAVSVSVSLKKSNREEGLRQVESEKESKTTPARVGGFDCRCLKISDKQEGFIYFLIDPSFKAANAHNVKVTVEYFDATQGRFLIEYDSQAEKYTKTQRVINQRGTRQWKFAEFVLQNTRFENLQDNNADFRLRIKTPEFFIRRIEVSRDTTVTASEEPALEQVSILLQETPVEKGLHLINHSDGKSTPAVMAGQSCRHIERHYLYFAIDPTFKWTSSMNVKVEVEYFDAANGQLGLHYDSWSQKGDSQGAYKPAPLGIPLRQAQKWQTETFVAPEARFENRENGRADFRLYASNPDVYIRSVKVFRTEVSEQTGPGYAGSNSVSIVLGTNNFAAGLHQAYDPDSKTSPAIADGQECISVRPAGSGPQSYIYFAVDPSFKRAEATNYVVEVEYFSPRPPMFRVQYNAQMPGGRLDAYRASPVTGGPANTWITAQILLAGALFKGGQNGNADFRLVSYAPFLHVRKVTLLNTELSTKPR